MTGNVELVAGPAVEAAGLGDPKTLQVQIQNFNDTDNAPLVIFWKNILPLSVFSISFTTCLGVSALEGDGPACSVSSCNIEILMTVYVMYRYFQRIY